MGVMGEKRRGGQLQTDQKVPKKTAWKCGKGASASAIVVSKEAVPVVLKLRLFVGGLGPTVGASDLEQRFAPLGTVHRIDLVEGKKGWDAEEALQRGFAYVDFEASSEASLRKLFSAYNGCKWKGGVLRVEKAKEHYTERLRREWAETEAEAAVKARIVENAEKAAANAIIPSRPMYSSKREDAWGSPKDLRVVLDEVIEEEGDGMAVDGDEIAAQIEKERKKQLDLLTKLFPEDKNAGDEEEKVIEIAKLRAFPMVTDVCSKKRKHALEISRAPLASSSVQPIEEECRGASVPESSNHVSGALDVNDRQKLNNRKVNFSEEAPARPMESLNDEKATKSQREDSTDSAKGVRSILKKTQDASKMDVNRDTDGIMEEDDGEQEDEEYYPSSRSPSPEGGLSDESKWQRLFNYAGLMKGREVTKSSNSAPSTLASERTVWTGINLDDNDAEPEVKTLDQAVVKNNGLFSGILSEQEDDEESDLPQQSSLGVNALDSELSKKKRGRRGGDASDGVFSGGSSDAEEGTDASLFDFEVQGSAAVRKSKNLTEEELEELFNISDFEDANEDAEDTESDVSSDFEMDEDEDEDEDMGDFVDAASSLKSLSPSPLNAAAKARKWAEIFKSASSVGEPVEGVFSGSLNEVDVAARQRTTVKVPKMFQSAAANHTGSRSEAPEVLDPLVSSDVMEDASTNPDAFPIQDVAKVENNDITEPSEEVGNGADDQQAAIVRGNLLAQFNKEQDEPCAPSLEQTSGAQSFGNVQQVGKGPGEEKNRDGFRVSSSIAAPEGQNAVDDNTKWMQRATWKSLMDADGRATFSLKQLTGDSETTTAPDVTKNTKAAAVPEKSVNAFSFNFARNAAGASEAKPKSISMPKPDSAVERNSQHVKISDDEEAGCSFMKSANAEKEWRASKSELRIDARAKHKLAVRKMKKMKGSGGAR